MSAPTTPPRTGRITRLMLKELREILRDRRTIGTLILMPLILYPLLSVGFQQFFLTGFGKPISMRYHVGFENQAAEEAIMSRLVEDGRLPLTSAEEAEEDARKSGLKLTPTSSAGKNDAPSPVGKVFVQHDISMPLADAVQQEYIDVGIRVVPNGPVAPRGNGSRNFKVELIWNRDAPLSRQALEFLQRHFDRANVSITNRRLARRLGVERVDPPLVVSTTALEDTDRLRTPGGGRSASIMAIIPLILIMMTVTGAVYPAIDLTAGERERGTLEILVAAPIPRIGLLFAKYVAVVAVALLTAAVNLVMMAGTLFISGIGQAIFGPGGLSLAVILQVFGLLILFAGFFSAVLLVLTSFARSFKEAQAYLIPLMLVSLAPGALCLKPDLHLEGLWLITPLVNIVLLGRDLFTGAATLTAVVMVVISTVLYALGAIAIAARVFGAESVLYSNPSGWGELFNRPSCGRKAMTVAGAMLVLALLFPLLFVVKNIGPRIASGWETSVADGPPLPPGANFFDLSKGRQLKVIEAQLVVGAIGTVLLFAGLPWIVARWRRIDIKSAFSLRWATFTALVGAALLGTSLWMGAHELVLLELKMKLVSLDPSQLEGVQVLASLFPDLPLPLILVSVAAAPAICEEWFFRGFLFSALRNQYSAQKTIVISALLFGLFHVVGQGMFTVERFLPSTALGLILGWICWRTGSIFPGMLMHFLNNGLVLTLGHYQNELKERGWDFTPAGSELRTGLESTAHLPPSWLATGAMLALAGFVLVQLGSGKEAGNGSGESPESTLTESPAS